VSYTPLKGSPQPPVPGSNIIEVALVAAQNLAAKIPVSDALRGEVDTVLSAIGAAVAAIDPDGQKGAERTAYLNAAYAMGPSGVQLLAGFATDQPPHPTAWVRLARWMCVQLDAADPFPSGP
jgi:hypothetical protein